MNLITSIAFLLLSVFFSTSLPQQQKQLVIEKTKHLENFDEVIVNHEAYTLKISIENPKSTNPILVIAMELKNKAHFISPLEEKEFMGKLNFDFGSYKDLAFKSKLIETPLAKAIILHPNFNPYGEKVLWVNKNTVYRQPLQIKTINDFEVFGRVQFTIEPKCTFEEIPFVIMYKDGEFTFTDPKC